MTSDELKLALAQRGLTFAYLDRENGLSDGSARIAAKMSHEAGERAIAAALEVEPSKIWPSRYDPETGERLKPQPARNYTYRPVFGQRLKGRAA